MQAGGELFQVTPEHPFQVESKGWVPVREIKVGDNIVAQGDRRVIVESIEPRKGDFVVYNFEVAVDHNYFVGEERLLTHNISALSMRRKLGIMRNTFLDAHHIVSRFASYESAKGARDILRKFGVSLESKVNGVALPRSVDIRRGMKAKWKSTFAHHGEGIHSHAYYDALERELSAAAAAGGHKAVLFKLEQLGNNLKMGVKWW